MIIRLLNDQYPSQITTILESVAKISSRKERKPGGLSLPFLPCLFFTWKTSARDTNSWTDQLSRRGLFLLFLIYSYSSPIHPIVFPTLTSSAYECHYFLCIGLRHRKRVIQYVPQTLLSYYNTVLLLCFIKLSSRHCIVGILHRNKLFYLNIGKCIEIIVKAFILLA